MKFTTLAAVVVVAQAAYTTVDPDTGAEDWDALEDGDCECVGVDAMPDQYGSISSTDCDDGTGGATYTCNVDNNTDADDSTTDNATDDDFAAVLTAATAGYSATYGDSCQNWDAEEAWCDEDDSDYDADADVTAFCDEDFIWCWVNAECSLGQVNTDTDIAANEFYSAALWAQCNSATKMFATMSAALAAAVITM